MRSRVPGRECEVQHGSVAHAIASVRIGGVEDRLHLVAREVGHQPLVGLLRGDGQQARLWICWRHEGTLYSPKRAKDLMAASRVLGRFPRAVWT